MLRQRWLIAGLLLVPPAMALAQAKDSAFKDPVFDVAALTRTPLNPQTLSKKEEGGIVTEEVKFHSEMDGDKSVDIFAFLVYPKDAKSLPAFIWNQGGLGKADAHMITHYGAKRGYAALCIDFPLPGYRSTGGYNIVSGLETAKDPKTAGIYHGAVALLKAVSYLQTRPEVDKDRIGMCGSSWGGFYTTLMVGVDPRLKVGSAMFGCGYLQTGNNWWGAPGGARFKTPEYVEHWMKTLDPGPRLKERKTPIAWFTGTDDMFYWMPSVMASYDAAAGPKHLTLLPNWAHALTPTGDEQVFTFLDIHLKGKPAFLKVTPLKVAKEGGKLVASWEYSGEAPRKAESANVILSYGDDGNWPSRYWKTLPAKLEGKTCKIELPGGAKPYFISGSVIDSDKFITSTPLLKVDPAALGVSEPQAKMDYDGCAEWGGFEPRQVFYEKAHAFMNPTVSKDAKEGKQSAELKPGKNRLYPIYFTVGVPHRFSCFLKADKPVEVTVKLAGSSDDKAAENEAKVQVGTDWTPVHLDFTPPQAKVASLSADVIVPEGAKVLADAVSFKPIE